MEIAFGKIKMTMAGQIRDHLTLVHALETAHPLVSGEKSYKPVLLTEKDYREIEKAREAMLDSLSTERLKFSPRLELRAVQLACAMSLMRYFQEKGEYIHIDPAALTLAVKFYIEEASVRSKETIEVEKILNKVGISTEI